MGQKSAGIRLALVVLLLLLPIILLGYLFVKQSNKDIGFALKELDGVNYLRAVMTVFGDLTAGRAPAEAENLKKQAAYLNATIPAKSESDTLLNILREKSASAEKAVVAGRELIVRIGDQSNLILDPDLDTYYLMDVTVQRLPDIAVLAQKVAVQHEIVEKTRQFSTDERAKLLVLTGELEAARLGLSRSFRAAFQANADGSLKSAMADHVKEFSQDLDDFLATSRVENEASQNYELRGTLQPQSLTELQVRLNDDLLQLWSYSADELQRLLEARVRSFKNQLIIAVGISIGVALLALAIAIGVFRMMLGRLDERILFLAHHDSLTSLPNRAYFTDQSRALIQKAEGAGDTLAVYFIDLDRFKKLNDTYGHAAGDSVIKTMGERLLAAAGTEALVSRMGGDEFVILHASLGSVAGAELLADRLITAMREPFQIGDDKFISSASVGFAVAPQHGYDLDVLLKSADLALYSAKAAGRNRYVMFNNVMREESLERNRIEQELRRALAEDRFTLDFQPQFDTATRELKGFEVLLRLRDAAGIAISPAQFIPIAEQTKLIIEIGAQVLRRACATAANWPSNLFVSVNLSPVQFEAGNISDVIEQALRSSGLNGSQLEVEITEGILLHHNETILAELRKIRDLGVSIAIDDFGAGYSSLSYLYRLPCTKLKIDRSFVAALKDSGNKAEDVIRAIVSMGHGLRMTVTAEGVEHAEQARTLLQFGCDQLQGFLLGRPVPEIDLAAFALRQLQNEAKPGLPVMTQATQEARAIA